MPADAQQAILTELLAYDWSDNGDLHDLGLTSVQGEPLLGVLTPRHIPLIMLINCHVRNLLATTKWSHNGHFEQFEWGTIRQFKWSTITIDCRNVNQTPPNNTENIGHTIVFTLGEYTRGEVYTSNAQLQLRSDTTGEGMFTTHPYAANRHTGTKFTIQ